MTTIEKQSILNLRQRPRRTRINSAMRSLVRETQLTVQDFILPIFVKEGTDEKTPISSMHGQFQWTVDRLPELLADVTAAKIPAVILFGIPAHKDHCGSENYNPDGIVPRAIRTIKDTSPDLLVISDMCFCEYTDHGHCGLINTPDQDHYDAQLPQGYLLNDPTLELLAQAAVVHAEAGADIIAPSGMVDGMVGAIREGLDHAGLTHISVMSYAVKYASAFYGPFRDAVHSAPSFGDRSQYQMDPANRREAMTEARTDLDEGADILMVKPAMPYLDVVRQLRDEFSVPMAAYQVSGEYAMLHAAAQNGWIDLRRAALESLLSIKRAGADMILTYFALDAVKWLEEQH